PTPALHLSRITLDLRQLRAEPHTKEVGPHGVYSSDCVRSACRHDRGGGAPARPATQALHPLTSDSPTILRFVKRLQRQAGAVRCCYEAGPCGFELQRALTQQAIP